MMLKCEWLRDVMQDVYISPDLTGDTFLQPSKKVHNRLWIPIKDGGKISALFFRCIDISIQIFLSPITLTGCAIKVLSISSFMRKNKDFQKKVLEKFDSIAALWQTTEFTSFDIDWYTPCKSQERVPEPMFTGTIPVTCLKDKQRYTELRENIVASMEAHERSFFHVGGFGSSHPRSPLAEDSYTISVYYQQH